MRLHPATQILIWCLLVATMQFLPAVRLLVAASLVLLMAFALSHRKFIQLLRRTRWVMLSLWLIYAFTTPGDALLDVWFSPSREGVLEGGLQMMRLLAALAGLAILLDRLPRQQLMAGLYSLFMPLQWLGWSRERVAVRLALTLHYAEAAMLRASMSWQDNLRSLFEPHTEEQKTMELPVYQFMLTDACLLAISVSLLWLALI